MQIKTKKMLPRLLFVGAGLLLACLAGQAAWALESDVAAGATVSGNAQAPIVVTLRQFKLGKDDKGAPKLEEAKVVMPGDVIEYRATYKNQSSAPISVAATLPVPEALEYIQDSAKSAGNNRLAHTVALKDSQFAAEPLMRKTIGADGVSVIHTVPYAEYRFVRWNLERLAPGSSVEISLRAKVAENQAPLVEVAR